MSAASNDTDWDNAAGGDWSLPTNWSQGVPSGPAAEATIAQAGTYTVTIAAGESYEVGGVTLDSPSATLLVAGDLTADGGVNLQEGTLAVSGSLAGTVTDSDVVLELATGPFSFASPIVLAGGILTWFDTLTGTANVTIAAGEVIAGSGALTDPAYFTNAPGVVALTNLGTIEATTGYVELEVSTLVNDGLLASDGQYLYVGAASFTNAAGGTIAGTAGGEVSVAGDFVNAGLITENGGYLVLGSSSGPGWSNTGSIVATDAIVDLYGDETDATIGTLILAGTSSLQLFGTLENAGQTLDGAFLPGLQLAGGTIVGGVVDAGAAGLGFGYQGGVLSGVTLIDGLTITGGAGTLADGSKVYADDGVTLGTVTVTSGGTIGFTSDTPYVIDQPVDAIGGGVVLAGDFTLDSTIDATGGTLLIGLGSETYDSVSQTYGEAFDSWTNNSAITGDGSQIFLAGDETVEQIGDITDPGGQVFFAGTLDNVGSTLNAADTSLLGLTLDGGTIEGGTVDIAGLGLGIASDYQYGFGGQVSGLDNVVAFGDLDVNGQLALSGTSFVYHDASLTTPATITVGYLGDLVFAAGASQSLANRIVLQGGGLGWQLPGGAGGTVAVTIGANETIDGYGLIADDNRLPGLGASSDAVDNLGTISSDTGSEIDIEVATFDNQGLILGTGYSDVAIDNGDGSFWTNSGTIELAGDGGLLLGGSFVNSGLISSGPDYGFADIGRGFTTYDAQNQSVRIDPTWVNNGTILIAPNDSVELDGDETVADIGTLLHSGAFLQYVGGTLDNIGALLNSADVALLDVQFSGGTIEGGTLDPTSLGLTFANQSFSDLDNVTVIGSLAINGAVDFSGTTTLYANASATSPGTIDVSYDGDLVFVGAGPATLTNPLILSGGEVSWMTGAAAGGTVAVTIAAGETVSGTGQLYDRPTSGNVVDLVNLGSIVDNVAAPYYYSGLGLNVAVSNFDNAGSIAVSNAAILTLGEQNEVYNPQTQSDQYVDSEVINTGVISVNAATLSILSNENLAQLGTIQLTNAAVFYSGGIFDNTGQTLNGADASLIGLQLGGGTIEGGTLDTTSLHFAASALTNGARSDLDNVTVVDNLVVDDPLGLTGSTRVYADAAATQAGTITVGNGGTLIFASATQYTLHNPLLLERGAVTWLPAGTLTGLVDVAVTAAEGIAGYGDIIDDYVSGDQVSLLNSGTIASDISGGNLLIGVTSFTNTGLLSASNGGSLSIGDSTFTYDSATGFDGYVYSAWVNTGTISINDASLFLVGDETVAAIGTVQLTGASVYYSGGTLANAGATLDGSDSSLLGLQLAGGTIAGGAINVAGLGFSVAEGGQSALDGVAVLGNLAVGGNLLLEDGSAIYANAAETTPGTISIGYYGDVVFEGPGPFTLTNDLILTGGQFAWRQQSGTSNAEAIVTIAAGVTVSGYGYLDNDYLSPNSVTNDGAIVANTRFDAIVINFATFTNAGLLLAENGGEFYIEPQTLTNVVNGVLSGGIWEATANSSLQFYGNNETVTDIDADIILSGANASESFLSTVDQVDTGGTLELDDDAALTTGPLTVAGTLLLGGGNLTGGAIDLAAGTIIGFGEMTGASFDDEGTVIASGGVLEVDAPVTGAGAFEVAAFGALALDSAGAETVSLTGQDGLVFLADAASDYSGTIVGFGGGDELIVEGFNGTAATWDAGVLTITGASGTARVNVAGAFASNAFSASIPQLGETAIELGSGQSLGLDAPAMLLDNPGTVVAVSGVQVLDEAGATLTVDLQADFGVLSLFAEGGAVEQGNGTGTLVLQGALAAVDNSLQTMQYRAPTGGTENDEILVDAFDADGGIESSVIAVTINQPPTIGLPSAAYELAGTAGPVDDLSINDPDTVAGEVYSVTVQDTAGLIGVSAVAGVGETGNNTTLLTLSGSIDDVNQALASLTFDGSENDSLTITANDERGGVTKAFVPVYVDQEPVFAAPGTIQAYIGTAVAVPGVSVIDPYGAGQGQIFDVFVLAAVGTLSATAAPGGTVTGDNTGTLELDGTLAAVNSELASLHYAGTLSGYISDTIGLGVSDADGGAGFGSIDALLPTPPVLTLPTDFIVGGGHESPLDGISVAVGAGLPGDTQVTLDLSDTNGFLSVKIDQGVSVTGQGSNNLELVGDVAALNTALSSLIYTGGASTNTERLLDRITFVASEDNATTIAQVDVDQPVVSGQGVAPQDFPVGVLDTPNYLGGAAYLQWDQDGNGYVGTLYADLPAYYGPTKEAVAAEITFLVFNNNISNESDGASVLQEPYAPVVGDWRSNAPAVLYDALQGFFATGSLFTATDLDAAQPDQITYTIKSTGSDAGQLPDRRLTIVFNKTTSITEPSPTSTTTGGFHPHPPPPPPPPPHPPKGPGGGQGDVHLTTYDGLYYDFQAAGEFVMAKSTQPGDIFEIQIRLQPWTNSDSVSVITEAAVAVGTNERITFDITRNNVVWQNGQALTLVTGATVDLGAATLTQLSSSSWQILYDSGETVTVTNAGTFLNVQSTIPSTAPAGAVEGLLGNDNGNAANDLSLADGTVLPTPLSYAQLYTSFADAWRVTQASSLLDYGAGQTTATFTDLNFPSDSVTLTSIPANVLQNAQLLVQQAGITNPTVADGAIEDYALTGDASFITSAAQASASEQSTAVMANPVNPNNVVGIGVGGIAAATTLSSSGTTAVSFVFYATGTFATAETISYAAVTQALGDFSASAFQGDVLPSGQVVIAAGQTSTTLTLDILGGLGTEPSGQLDLEITANGTPGNAPVIAASAHAVVDNDVPVAGTAAVPVFLDPNGVGTLTKSGSAFTLFLGTYFQGSTDPLIDFDIANVGPAGANTLLGDVTESGGQVGFVNGLHPVSALVPGQSDPFTATVFTGQLGTIATTVTFDANARNASGYQAAMTPITLTFEAVIVDQPPTLALPAAELELAGRSVGLGGLSVINTGAAASTKLFTIALSDTSGTLTAPALDGGSVIGSGSSHVTLTGGLTAVNAELADLSFTGIGPDTLVIGASDGAGGTATGSVAILADSAPVISAPGSATTTLGLPGTITGISLADTPLAIAGGTLLVSLADSGGLLSATAQTGAVVVGTNSNELTISGTLAAVNAALATLVDNAGTSPNTLTLTATDPLGLAAGASVAVTEILPPPPTITAPGSAEIDASGVASGLGYLLGVTDADLLAASSITVSLTDLVGTPVAGTFTALATGAATVSGSGSGHVVISGDLTDVDSVLASLLYTGAQLPYAAVDSSTDMVMLDATDAFGSTSAQTIDLTVDQIPNYENALAAIDTLGGDYDNSAPDAQVFADGVSTYSNAVSGAIGDVGTPLWQQSVDASSAAAATLAAAVAAGAPASVLLADAITVFNGVVAGVVGAVAGRASSDAIAAIAAAAAVLGADIAASASGNFDNDIAGLYTAIANAVSTAGDLSAATAASDRSAATLAADIAGNAPTAQILADTAALYDSVVSGSLGAIGGASLQQAWAGGNATIAASVTAAAPPIGFAQDIGGLYNAVVTVIVAPSAGSSYTDVISSAATLASTLAAAPTQTTVVNAAAPLYVAENVAIAGDVSGQATTPLFNTDEAAIQALIDDATANASTDQLQSDLDSVIDDTIVGVDSLLGLSTSITAYQAGLQDATQVGNDLDNGASPDQLTTDFSAYLGQYFGGLIVTGFGGNNSQYSAVEQAFNQIGVDLEAGTTANFDADLTALFDALTAPQPGSTGTNEDQAVSDTVQAESKKSSPNRTKQLQQFIKENKAALIEIATGIKNKSATGIESGFFDLVVSTQNNAFGAAYGSTAQKIITQAENEFLLAAYDQKHGLKKAAAFHLQNALKYSALVGLSISLTDNTGVKLSLTGEAEGFFNNIITRDIDEAIKYTLLPGSTGLHASTGSLLFLGKQFAVDVTGVVVSIGYQKLQKKLNGSGKTTSSTHTTTAAKKTRQNVQPRVKKYTVPVKRPAPVLSSTAVKAELFKQPPSTPPTGINGGGGDDNGPGDDGNGPGGNGNGMGGPGGSSGSGSGAGGAGGGSGGGAGGSGGTGGGPSGGGVGDVHLTTFDGLYYNFQAAGEFVLARSTLAGDAFQVQIRLQPWTNSASVSVITAAAVAVGTDRVTFDLHRTNVVYVNGQPIALATGGTHDLAAGSITQLTASSWDVLLDSGESVTVTNSGTFLDVNAVLPANAVPGTVTGLLGNDAGNTSNDLQLPDGAVLSQPLSYTDLYTTFANAWRVTQASSLLDYGAGQTTASFTDPNFPADAAVLASLPANVLANAAAMVDAAGITNTALADGAEEDYALTGDPAFITSAAQQSVAASGVVSQLADPTGGPAPLGVGVGAVQATVIENPSGTTAVDFLIYSTTTAAIAQAVTYAVAAGAGDLGAASFAGGVLPSGTLTIAAGQTVATLELDVIGTIGDIPAATLALGITSRSEPVVGASAAVDVANNQALPGVAAIPVFLSPGTIGVLSDVGSAFTLDLGNFAQSENLANIVVDIANQATTGADTLFGDDMQGLANTGNLAFSTGLPPVAALTGGQIDPLTFSVDTQVAGTIDATLTFDANEFNASGYQAVLTPITLTVIGNVLAAGPTLLTLPGALELPGTTVPLSDLSFIDGADSAVGALFTLTLSDSTGLLGAAAADGGTSVGSGTPTLVLMGSFDAINAELAGVTFTGTAADRVSLTISDGLGATGSALLPVIPDILPVLTVPAGVAAPVGQAGTIAGISIADPAVTTAGAAVAISIFDTTGLLSATALGGVEISGAGSTTLTLAGSVAAVDASLATLTDTGGAGAEMLGVVVADPLGLTATGTIAVTPITPPPPVLYGPASAVLPLAATTGLPGIAIGDPGLAAAGGTITMTLSDSLGLLASTDPSGDADVSGGGTNVLTISGSLGGVNTQLADLTVTAPAGQASDRLSVQAVDPLGQTTITSVGLLFGNPPEFTVPSAVIVPLGGSGGAGGVSLADPGGTGLLGVVLSDTTGLLGVAATSGVTVTGAGTTTISLSGSLAALDTALAGLTIGGPKSTGFDDITLVATDAFGLLGTASLPVEFDTAPSLGAPAMVALTGGQAGAIAGITLADPGVVAGNGSIVVSVTDRNVLLSATPGTGATLGGAGTDTLTLIGSVSGVAAGLASLTGTPPAGAVSDSISIIATDPLGLTSQADIAVEPAEAPCFVAGTRIVTPDGWCPVEALAAGDLVLTASGAVRAVRWVGARRIDCTRHKRPELVWPVRIAAGAFAETVPVRDLWLSPDHAVFLADSDGGALIPAARLINGATIRQEPVERVHYIHVELDSHDVLLAEGLPAESYLDTGNRAMFHGGADALVLHPDFAPQDWSAACAPLCLTGTVVVAARRQLLTRAAALGHRLATGSGLRLMAGGREVRANRVQDGVYRFLLPPATRRVTLCSPAGLAAASDPASEDRRCLGLAIGGLLVDGRLVPLDHAALGAGFHPREPNVAWRWTDGAARLDLPARAGLLEVRVVQAMPIWAEADDAAVEPRRHVR